MSSNNTSQDEITKKEMRDRSRFLKFADVEEEAQPDDRGRKNLVEMLVEKNYESPHGCTNYIVILFSIALVTIAAVFYLLKMRSDNASQDEITKKETPNPDFFKKYKIKKFEDVEEEAQPDDKGRENLAETLVEKIYGSSRGSTNYIVILFFIAFVIIAVAFYVLDIQPVFLFEGSSSTIGTSVGVTSPPSNIQPSSRILGRSNNEILIANSNTGRIYAYNTETQEEREVITVPQFENYLWHSSGKFLLVSNAENALGNLYLYNFTRQPLEPELLTARETEPHFPPNLQIDVNSQAAWSQNGDLLAFTARNIDSKLESLFVYELSSLKLTNTPARGMEKISSLLWINNGLMLTNTTTITTEVLSFVAVNDGRENLYLVDWSSGGFTRWIVK